MAQMVLVYMYIYLAYTSQSFTGTFDVLYSNLGLHLESRALDIDSIQEKRTDR